MFPRKLYPGQSYTATEQEALARQAMRAGQVTGTGALTVAGNAANMVIRDNSDDVIYARITGAPTGSSYPWIEVARNGSTWDDVTVWPGRSGTAAALPAVELAGRTDVPTNAIVELTPLPGGTGLGFSYGAGTLNTQNVDGTAQDTTTGDIRANQASYIKFTTTGGYQRLDIDTAGLCADTTFADCVQSNMTFDVEVDVPSCVSVVLTKTTAVVSGTTVLTDVSAAVFWKVRKVTLPANTIVGDEGYCITAGECCPTGATAVTVACCPDPIPMALTLTISGGGGSFPMTWSVANSRWETGSITVSGCGTINVTLRCTGSNASGLTIASDVGSNCNLSFSNVTRSCDPFQVQADGLFQSPGFPTCSCVGTTRVFTITP